MENNRLGVVLVEYDPGKNCFIQIDSTTVLISQSNDANPHTQIEYRPSDKPRVEVHGDYQQVFWRDEGGGVVRKVAGKSVEEASQEYIDSHLNNRDITIDLLIVRGGTNFLLNCNFSAVKRLHFNARDVFVPRLLPSTLHLDVVRIYNPVDLQNETVNKARNIELLSPYSIPLEFFAHVRSTSIDCLQSYQTVSQMAANCMMVSKTNLPIGFEWNQPFDFSFDFSILNFYLQDVNLRLTNFEECDCFTLTMQENPEAELNVFQDIYPDGRPRLVMVVAPLGTALLRPPVHDYNNNEAQTDQPLPQ